MTVPGVTDEVLTAFADGELAPEEEARVRAAVGRGVVDLVEAEGALVVGDGEASHAALQLVDDVKERLGFAREEGSVPGTNSAVKLERVLWVWLTTGTARRPEGARGTLPRSRCLRLAGQSACISPFTDYSVTAV